MISVLRNVSYPVTMSLADGIGFQSLLQAIEAEDTEGRIEIHIYLTAKIEYVLPSSVHLLATYPSPSFPRYGSFLLTLDAMKSEADV